MRIAYHIAKTPEEQASAAAIVKREYLRSGYIDADGSLADTPGQRRITVVASENGGLVIATVSLVLDSPAGLPMDTLYQEETSRLRRTGSSLAEVTRLAHDTQLSGTGNAVFPSLRRAAVISGLFRFILHLARHEGADMLCIAINPKHRLFYDALGFLDIGGLKRYTSLNQAPAIAKALRIDRLEKASGIAGVMARQILEPISPEALRGDAPLVIDIR